jgi:chorismate mutase
MISKNSNKIPRNLINDIFSSQKNENILNISNNNLYIVSIKDIIIPENLISELISMNSDLRSAFGQELIQNKKIKTNDNLINALLDQY